MDRAAKTQFFKDRRRYSLAHGNDRFIARARRRLESVDGGWELLLSLVEFDPEKRATALDVMNSRMMAQLQEGQGKTTIGSQDHVLSYMAYAAK